MGLLVGESSETLTYDESRKFQRMLKSNAARQLARLLHKYENFTKTAEEALCFGTELECHLLKRIELNHCDVYSVYVDSKPLMADINTRYPDVEVKEEYSAWMIEFIPKVPFRRYLSLGEIRTHFKRLHAIAEFYEDRLTILPGLSVLPHIGTANYYLPEAKVPGTLVQRAEFNPHSKSDYFLDSTITKHSRFRTFTSNTRLRKGDKPEIVLPILQDKATTNSKFVLDHFGFGMCNTALQITYSCRDLAQARFAHDMLHVISPFMLVFSSTTFAASHQLLDIDNRFVIIEQSTDDRKQAERAKLDKTRYSTINYFLSDSPKLKKHHNDKKKVVNYAFYKLLKKHLKAKGSKLAKDKRLLLHFAYLFVRDYLIVFPERLVENYEEDTLDFEAIQSSNWNDMRLKPPSSYDSGLGWLLEFRCMDSPLTEIEKSLLTFLTTIFFRIVTDPKLDINFYMPMTKVDENFHRAFKRDSTTEQRFFFRRHFCPKLPGYVQSEEVVELTLTEFWEGTTNFAGMKALFQLFIKENEKDLLQQSQAQGEPLIELIEKVHAFFGARAAGKLETAPNFFRKFIFGHPEYQADSYINDKITTDVIDLAVKHATKGYEKSTMGDFTF